MPVFSGGIESKLSIDTVIVNAEKEAKLGTFTAERMIKFLQKASIDIDKMIKTKVNVPALTRLSNFIEDLIITSLDGFQAKDVRYQLHKSICQVLMKLVQHCPVWSDASIEKL